MKKFLRYFIPGLLFVSAVSAISAQKRVLDVWDFGGVEAEGAQNHISLSDIENLSQLGEDGKFAEAGEISFGDLTFKVDKNDRAYNSGKKNYGSQSYTNSSFDDGYESNGAWYCNGKGGENKRFLLLNNVNSGDVVTFYAQTSNGGDEKIHFASVDEEGERDDVQDEIAPITNEAKLYSYVALRSGSYKVYCEASVGKPVYFRIARKRGVQVSGALSSLPAGNAELKFILREKNQEFKAKISGKSYSVSLPAGNNFAVVLSGIKGYGVNPATKQLSIEENAGASLKKDLVISEQTSFPISGKILGFNAGYVPQTAAKILMVPPKKSTALPVEIEVKQENGEYSFAGEIEPSILYTATLDGANDYEITGDAEFEGSASFEKNITVAPRKTYDVSGKFFGEIKEFPKAVKFKNVADGYVYDGRVSTLNYSVELRDGIYEVICETSIAHSVNHIVVDKNSVIKDVKLSLKEKTIRPLPPKKELWVGPKRGQYPSVAEAIAAARAMNPLQERDRITIMITPGVYRNQLIIDVPYITLKNADPAKEVKLTWYYGIGYKYYSVDSNGWYDEDLAYDKFTKKTPAKWGAATYIKNTANSFRAEGITFETSFNKYITDEELADGVECEGFSFVRKLNSDVRSKAATERSSAILIEADQTEFFNCKFLGSQDTLYTGSGIKGYLRKCFIEGNTDFIFGDGNFVFENCEIRFAGYSDKAKGGYITAARTAAESKGYLFLDCLISADSNAFIEPGYFGRPWGKDAAVAWINTVFGSENLILPEGWTEMSGNKVKDARFRELNTTWAGNAVDVSKRPEDSIPQITKDFTMRFYLGQQWKPEYYTEPKPAKAKPKKPVFTSDDDLGMIYPGHTITVNYTMAPSDDEDVSLIKWYRDKDGKSELVKQTTGFGDKTYLIDGKDSGGVIRCLIIPRVRGGEAQKPVEAKLDKKINESYSIPANVIADRPRVNGSVKVFLASDSTCKDYSALGMWSEGQIRNEGGWGEFLGSYFNGTVSVQDYANGGRSSRSFINEGTLDKIEVNISRGDYLFIQFGHNDCSNSAGYLEERYVPLGRPDKKGIYPVTPGKKVDTPQNYASKYGATFYSWDCGGTYKWYLKQYIDVARKAGATPILVTPVSRLYYTSDGKIRPHHDSTDTSTEGTQTTENNAYVEAVRQLAKEEKVILIDAFEMTKALYEKAYAEKKDNSEAKKLMFEGDSTHNNKLGAFIVAGLFAKAVKTQIPGLAKGVVHPVKAMGENADGSLTFTVDSKGKFACDSEYWTNYTQKMLDIIK